MRGLPLEVHRFIWFLSSNYALRVRRAYPAPFDQRRAIFVHVPRTAGISLSQAIFGCEVGHFRLRDYQGMDARRYANYFKFAFVRNPWDRVVSAFTFLSAGGMAGYAYDAAFKRQVIDRYGSFERFVLEWLSGKNIHKHVHFFPQHGFVVDGDGNLALDFVGRFESLASDFVEVCKRLDLRTTLPAMNRSTHRHYTHYYTNQEMIDKVGQLYAADVRLFGYTY